MLYKYNDMVMVFVRGLELFSGKDYFPLFNTGSLVSRIDFLNGWILQLLFYSFNPVTAANILAILYLFITLFITHFVFSKIVKDKTLAAIFALFYAFSIYYVYRVVSFTPSVYQTFFYPLIFYFLWVRKSKPLLLSVLVFLFFNLSSYMAYFAFMATLFWFLADGILEKDGIGSKVKAIFLRTIKFTFPLFVMILIVYLPVLMKSLPILSRYSNLSPESTEHSVRYDYRPLEDWYNFSMRPWYFVIPPERSIFFGEFSESVHKRISDTGYYLANDYEEEEMAGAYLGWHFVIGVFVALYLYFSRRVLDDGQRKLLARVFLVIATILLFSLPPSFTVSGFTVYTPTYLSFLVFPVFRTLVRWSAALYFFVLLINLVLFDTLLKSARAKIYKFIVVGVLVVLTFILMAVRVPIINLSRPPEEIAFLGDYVPEDSTIAVFPDADYYSIFWTLSHKKKILNPVGFKDLVNNYDSEKISVEMVTVDGLDFLKSKSANILVFYKSRISDNDLEDISELNPEANSIERLDKYFRENFGPAVFERPDVVIYALGTE